jgi:SAM-dependent methyltransferase
MSQAQLSEHAGYLGDRVKLEAYESALRQLVRPDSVVLDLGAGTGILGLLAARVGAKRVYSVDSGSILATTEAVAMASGYGDRLVFIRQPSSRLQLSEPVDLVVCDQIGGMAYDAGVLDYFADVRRRLLAPDGIFIPGAFQLLAAPVASSDWDDNVGVWASRPAGFDLSPFFELATNTEFRVEIPTGEFLGAPTPWATIEADHDKPIAGQVDLAIEQPGTLNAIAGMFVASLAPSVELTNCPFLFPQFKRWQNLYPLPVPVPVVPGDRVQVRFDIRPRTYLATWSVTVDAQSQPEPVRSRNSTILGLFLTPTDLAVTSGQGVARPSPLLEADRHILSQVDGARSVAAIVASTWAGYGPAFTSLDEVKRRVESLLWRHLQPEPTWPSSPTAS